MFLYDVIGERLNFIMYEIHLNTTKVNVIYGYSNLVRPNRHKIPIEDAPEPIRTQMHFLHCLFHAFT